MKDGNITISEIQNITDTCIRLLNCTEYLRRDGSAREAHTFAREIFDSIRKLFVASIMFDKQLICISGIQGAGKTTLMRNFYGIDDKYLNITQGRGERIPVLITEDDVRTPQMYAIKLQCSDEGVYSQIREDMTAKEFVAATKGEDQQIMYLELIVPYRHTYNNGVSFMLLPGFENKNEYWNNLIEFSINSSDAAVFVFNESSFSSADNDKYLKMVESKFGKNLVYVISHTDDTTDGNAEVKKICMDVLRIRESEEDRVVCTGQFNDSAKNDEWITKFKRSLEKYAYQTSQPIHNNAGYIYRELEKITDKLYNILEVLNADDSDITSNHRNNEILRAFDAAVAKKRRDFEENITDEFELAKSKSGEKLENAFKEIPLYKNLPKTFFGTNVKNIARTREMIMDSLKDGDNYLPDEYLATAMEKTLIMLDNYDRKEKRTDLNRLIDTKQKDEKILLLTDSEKSLTAISDIRTLMEDNSQKTAVEQLKNPYPKNVVGAITEISTYYYCMNCYNSISEKIGLPYYTPSNSLITGDAVIKGAESSKKFAVGLAGVMGIDLIGDGSLNFISQIAASVGVAAPVAGVVAAAVVGAGALAVVTKDLNRMQRNDFMSARLSVNSVYDNLKLESLKRYDRYFERIRERIEDNLRIMSGEGKKAVAVYNAKVEVNNALNLLKDINEKYTKENNGMGSFIS